MFLRILSSLSSRVGLSILFNKYASRSDKHLVGIILLNNFFPMLGAILFGWNIGDILVFFWVDNVILGLFHAIKLSISQPEGRTSAMNRVRFVLGFIFEWAFVSFVHGVFAFMFTFLIYAIYAFNGPDYFTIDEYSLTPLITATLGSFTIHLIDFLINYIKNKEYLRNDPKEIRMIPFTNVLALHCSLLVFGWAGGAMLYFFNAIFNAISLVYPDQGGFIAQLGFISFSLLAAIAIGLFKSYSDMNIFYNADKLGFYTTKSQKLASMLRRKKALSLFEGKEQQIIGQVLRIEEVFKVANRSNKFLCIHGSWNIDLQYGEPTQLHDIIQFYANSNEIDYWMKYYSKRGFTIDKINSYTVVFRKERIKIQYDLLEIQTKTLTWKSGTNVQIKDVIQQFKFNKQDMTGMQIELEEKTLARKDLNDKKEHDLEIIKKIKEKAAQKKAHKKR